PFTCHIRLDSPGTVVPGYFFYYRSMCKHRMSIAGCPLNLENESPLSGTALYSQIWYISLPKQRDAVAREREPKSYVQPKKLRSCQDQSYMTPDKTIMDGGVL